MVTIVVEDPDGKSHIVEAREDMTLMEAIRWAGLPLRSSCGGSMACGTCHVILDDESFAKVRPPSKDEDNVLDEVCDVTPTSRLSCQIIVEASLQNLRVKLRDPWR